MENWRVPPLLWTERPASQPAQEPRSPQVVSMLPARFAKLVGRFKASHFLPGTKAAYSNSPLVHLLVNGKETRDSGL